MAKKIKIDSTAKMRIKPTRKAPPTAVEGLLEDYRTLKKQNDSLQRSNDSLQRVIIELKGKIKKK